MKVLKVLKVLKVRGAEVDTVYVDGPGRAAGGVFSVEGCSSFTLHAPVMLMAPERTPGAGQWAGDSGFGERVIGTA